MGERIKNAISNENLEKIFKFIYSGELKGLREKAIYCDRKNNNIVTPKDFNYSRTCKKSTFYLR